VLIACFTFGWFALLPDEYKQLGMHIAGGVGFISNFLFWNESGYFDNAAETKPLLHLWSLGIEEQFYIAWPLMMWFAWKQRWNLLTVTIVFVLISFALNLHKVSGDAVAAFYSPQTRFWELLVGSVLAYVTLHKQKHFSMLEPIDARIGQWLGLLIHAHPLTANGNTLRHSQSLFGATLIIVGFFYITKVRAFPGWWALLPTVGTVLVIAAGKQAWLNRVVLSNRVLIWFGLISFPLYLWHWPLLSFARIVEGQTPSAAIRIAAVLISILLAWLTYRLIEKPIRFGNHSQAKTITLLVLMLVVGLAGWNSYQRNGLEFRFPKEVNAFTDYIDFQWPEFVRSGECHIQNRTITITHKPLCYEQINPVVVLWGDSHASSLYPGLKKLQNIEKFGVTQLTQAGCPPILDLVNLNPEDSAQRDFCNKINQVVVDSVGMQKPDVLIIHSAWETESYLSIKPEIYSKFIETLNTIKRSSPTTKIIVIGPVPRWADSPQKTSYLSWKRLYKKDEMPSAIQFASRLDDVDMILENISHKAGVHYISAIKVLCNLEGCVSRVGEELLDFVAIDSSHFSKAGSEYFIDKISGIVLSKFSQSLVD
jgi:peptidoglycan/LPS O-acetylase OafA/YrhL